MYLVCIELQLNRLSLLLVLLTLMPHILPLLQMIRPV